jgi:uncharacterized protein YyaL (SSP411 family)
MLYDQAQLATSYLEAFQITGNQDLAETARGIFNYVLRDMTAEGFFSAEDADSAIDPARPNVKGEGAFYIWSAEEIERLLGSPTAEWFSYRYGVKPEGNVANDPHREFTGKNILFAAHSVEATAEHFGRDVDEVRSAILQAERTLLEARALRPRPHLDDKILTSWNGLMISAFALGGAVLNESAYANAARRAADFILARMCNPATGELLRRYRDGEAAVPAFLEDYALLSQALLDLYETQFNMEDLKTAVRLSEKQSELFEDREHGGFFSSADPTLVLRVKEDYDGAEPSGNSVAILNLLRLARMTGRSDFQQSAERALAAFAPRLTGAPVALPQMLAACEFLLGGPREIVIAGGRESADTAALLRVVFARFLPNRIVLLVDSAETQRALASGVPGVDAMRTIDGRATAYVCRNYACQAPVFEVEKLAELLQ